MIRSRACRLLLFGLAIGPARARGDQFEQLDGPTLARAIKGGDATPRAALTISDLGAMPPLLRDTRSALVLASTDLGNPVRLLVVPELRKPLGGVGAPIPVIVLERFDTFDASEPSTRLATRRDLVVFDGFQVDLDTGQVVPEGQGGDVVFRAKGDHAPRLEPIGPAKLLTLTKAPALDLTKPAQPTPGKLVLPGDFAGRYRLFANGIWSGTLDLKVEGKGLVIGEFRSDLHGTTYPVSGQVATDSAQKILFAIKYPRARHEFEGYLWAEGKGAIAGVASLNERPAGFFAVREGGRYAPEGLDLGPLTPSDSSRPGRHVLDVAGDRLSLDGKEGSVEGVVASLRGLAESEAGPPPWVSIRASRGETFADVLRAVESVRSSGIRSVRFETAEREK